MYRVEAWVSRTWMPTDLGLFYSWVTARGFASSFAHCQRRVFRVIDDDGREYGRFTGEEA